MTNEARPLILASGSPRRRELLGRIAAAMCRQVCDNVRWKRNYAKAACTL